MVSYSKLGVSLLGGAAKANGYYLKFVETFKKMKADGILAPADEKWIDFYQQKADAISE